MRFAPTTTNLHQSLKPEKCVSTIEDKYRKFKNRANAIRPYANKPAQPLKPET